MFSIDPQKNKVTIKFENSIYFVSAIEQALNDFSEILRSKFELTDYYIIVTLLPKEKLPEKELKTLALEFSTYVFGVMKNNNMV